jgi:hypothetical protein
MNKNRIKAIFLSVIVSLFALGGFFAPLASAATDPGSIQKYLEIPITISRPTPTFKNATGCEDTSNCKDIATGIGVYGYIGSSHTAENANFSGVTAIDVTNVDPKDPTPINPKDTSTVLTPNWAVVNGALRVYDLTIGHTYKVYFIFEDAKSSDVTKFVGLVNSYCENVTFGRTSNVPANEQKAADVVLRLKSGCARYNIEPFLPAAVNPFIINGDQPVAYRNAVTRVSAQSVQAKAPTNPSVVASDDSTDDCPLAAGSPLRWLGCPLISIGASTVQTLQHMIENFLFTPVAQIFDNAGFKATANTFRVLGIALVIIAGLIMVISQAVGLELFDAYTIRKVLPRLAIALIGMALAWPILRFVIVFFDDLGLWASSLIGAVPHVNTAGHDDEGAATALTAAFAGVGGGAAVAALGFGGILSLIGTILLALLVGFIVLAVRQMVILVAVLMAPLAIAAYVLPGTQKLWNFWKDALLTSMVMFPIIMIFLASGKALSSLLSSAGTTEMTILAIFVYFAPFFLLPFAFKLAGGLMSTIFSIANDRGRGGFDRLKKYRQGKVAGNFQAMKQGNRYKGNSAMARGFNRTTRGAAIVASGEVGINPARWKSQVGSAISRNTLDEAREAIEKNPFMRNIASNDDFMMAALESKGDEREAKKILLGKGYDDRSAGDAAAAIRSAKRSMSNDAFETAAALALPATGTAFQGGAGEMHEWINNVTGNDRNRAATMLASMRSGAMQARRFDLGGGGFGDQLKSMNGQYNGTISSAQATETTLKESLEGQGGGYIAAAKKTSVKNFAPVMLDNLQAATATGDTTRTAHELAKMAGRYDAMASVAPENADVLAHEVMAKEIIYKAPVYSPATATSPAKITGYATKKASVRQAIEDWRGTGDFQEMRREYQNAAVAGAAAASAAAAATAAGVPPGPTAVPGVGGPL